MAGDGDAVGALGDGMSDHVQWQTIEGQPCLFVDFEGHLDREGAQERLEAIDAALAEREGPIVMIWEASEMSGYDKDARTLWQEHLVRTKPRLKAIHLVTNSFVIRMGASVVSMFMRYPIRTWASMDAVRL